LTTLSQSAHYCIPVIVYREFGRRQLLTPKSQSHCGPSRVSTNQNPLHRIEIEPALIMSERCKLPLIQANWTHQACERCEMCCRGPLGLLGSFTRLCDRFGAWLCCLIRSGLRPTPLPSLGCSGDKAAGRIVRRQNSHFRGLWAWLLQNTWGSIRLFVRAAPSRFS
jgi:hypothetical protein